MIGASICFFVMAIAFVISGLCATSDLDYYGELGPAAYTWGGVAIVFGSFGFLFLKGA